ncbi:MAG: radical SAM protein [Nitrospinaceae bacterium]
MARKRLIVPIFIAHEGCPYRCVFCSQNDITGARRRADADQVRTALETYLNPSARALPAEREAAFYGGSFTGLPVERQEFLLSLVQPWIDRDQVQGIRVSTHCLFIDADRLTLLKRYRVRTVELGLQSTDPEVLERSGRPCSMKTVRDAVGLIRENEFNLGLQLMPGLPGDCERTFQQSVADTIALRPNFVRLYPALVLRHTRLYDMYMKKEYSPWSLERTLDALTSAVKEFQNAGIPVIRIGLHPDPSMLENLVAGPYHPALRYLVDCRIGLGEMTEKIKEREIQTKSIWFKVPINSIPIYTGNKRENIGRLKAFFHLDEIKLEGVPGLKELELVA